MAPNLADFPDEILWMILGRFCLHCTQEHSYDAPDGYFRPCERGEQDPDSPSWYSHEYSRVLYSMCLVSRRFLSVAQPLLHHNFLPGYGDSWRSNTFSWPQRLSAFVHTMARRRDLAACVKRIYLHPYLFRDISPEEAQSALEDAAHVLTSLDMEAYTAHFQEILTEVGELQADGLRLFGVMLALVPNLHRLSLQVTGPGDCVPGLAFQILGPRPLSTLETLDICSHSEGSTLFSLGHHANGILEVAGSNLQSLNLHMCGADGLRIGGVTLHLRHLRLTQSRLNEEELGALVSACFPGLVTFVYEASYPFQVFESYVDGCIIMPATFNERQPADHLFRHLVKYKDTLKSLHFDLRNRHYSNSIWDGGSTIPLTGTDTLTSFSALEDVFLSSSLLCNQSEPGAPDEELLTRLLPPNIKTLKLAGKDIGRGTNRLASALVGLANAVVRGDERFGRLEHVRCDAMIAEVIEEIAIPEIFASAGVDFGFETWPLSEPTVPKGALPEWDRLFESLSPNSHVLLPSLPGAESDLGNFSLVSPVSPSYSPVPPTFPPVSPPYAPASPRASE